MRPVTSISAFVLGGLISLGPVSVSAQAKVDFSGRWTADAPAAPGRGGGGRGDMGSGWGSPITITQDAAKLTVEYVYFARGDMQPPLRFTYALDGSETTNTVMMGRGIQTQRSRVAWQGEKLVITTIHALADPGTGKPTSTTVTQTLSVEAGSLVLETTRAGALGGQPGTTKTTYKKAQ